MYYFKLIALFFCVNIAVTIGLANAQEASLFISQKDITAKTDSTIELEVVVSTTSEIGFAQFVLEFSSDVLEFVNAEVDSQTLGFSILLNTELPFSTTASGTDKNVLIQLSGGGTRAFQGEKQKVLRLSFAVKGQQGTQSPLAFDENGARTFLTKTNLEEIKGDSIEFVNSNLLVVSVPLKASTPKNFELMQNYPNPFNPNTNIAFTVEHESVVKLVLYDVAGKTLKTILDNRFTAGRYNVDLDMSGFASGVYYYVLESGASKIVKKMVLIK